MDIQQFEQFRNDMQSHIADTIRLTVNGKIDGLRRDLAEYIKDDNQWKQEAQPVIEMGKNLTGFGKVTMTIVAILAAVGSVWGIIEWITSKIK